MHIIIVFVFKVVDPKDSPDWTVGCWTEREREREETEHPWRQRQSQTAKDVEPSYSD